MPTSNCLVLLFQLKCDKRNLTLFASLLIIWQGLSFLGHPVLYCCFHERRPIYRTAVYLDHSPHFMSLLITRAFINVCKYLPGFKVHQYVWNELSAAADVS